MAFTLDRYFPYLVAPELTGQLARRACRAVALLAPLCVYLATAAPSVQPGDSAELSTAVATLGIPHAPGYPVYVMASYPFTLLPVGDVAYRVNVASAVYGAVCVVLIFELLLALGVRPLPSLFASQFAAFSYYFWAQSVIAEIYTFDAMLLIAMLRALVGFQQRRGTGWLCAAGVAAGLGVANRSGFAMFAPLVALALVRPSARPDLRQAAMCLLAFLVGLSSYLFVPIRSVDASAYVWGGQYLIDGSAVRPNLTSPDNLWDFFTLGPFHQLFFAGPSPSYSDHLSLVATWVWAAFLGSGALLGLVGVARAWTERRLDVLAIAATSVVYLGALTVYYVPDRDAMLLPFVVLWAIPAGFGLGLVWAWDTSHVFKVSLALCLATMFVVNQPLASQSGSSARRDEGVRLMDSFERDAIVIGSWPQMSVMDYLQRVEGTRPDLRLVQMWATGPDFAYAIADANRLERPVYVQLFGPAPPELKRHYVDGWAVFDASGTNAEETR